MVLAARKRKLFLKFGCSKISVSLLKFRVFVNPKPFRKNLTQHATHVNTHTETHTRAKRKRKERNALCVFYERMRFGCSFSSSREKEEARNIF